MSLWSCYVCTWNAFAFVSVLTQLGNAVPGDHIFEMVKTKAAIKVVAVGRLLGNWTILLRVQWCLRSYSNNQIKSLSWLGYKQVIFIQGHAFGGWYACSEARHSCPAARKNRYSSSLRGRITVIAGGWAWIKNNIRSSSTSAPPGCSATQVLHPPHRKLPETVRSLEMLLVWRHKSPGNWISGHYGILLAIHSMVPATHSKVRAIIYMLGVAVASPWYCDTAVLL